MQFYVFIGLTIHKDKVNKLYFITKPKSLHPEMRK